MSVYLDASVVVSLFVRDVHSARVAGWFATGRPTVLSVWATTEFTSALSFYVRTGRLTVRERKTVERNFDQWRASYTEAELTSADFQAARALLLDDVSLRAPDALHLAFAKLRALEIATLDEGLAKSAKASGVAVTVL
ncbi:MAG TPA: type II toxin-antitoxin system VapC family toxin [Caulobacteraceae bacterium]